MASDNANTPDMSCLALPWVSLFFEMSKDLKALLIRVGHYQHLSKQIYHLRHLFQERSCHYSAGWTKLLAAQICFCHIDSEGGWLAVSAISAECEGGHTAIDQGATLVYQDTLYCTHVHFGSIAATIWAS